MRFAIAANTGLNFLETADMMENIFPAFIRNTAFSFFENKNMLVLDNNFEHDDDKIHDADGWMFYQYEISVFPINETDLEYQRKLSKSVLEVFVNNGFLAEIICDDDFYNELIS
ncbi:hypothetical protein [Pectobacterium wasabiae]|nr:hypothetical protein [Pectobacterium wasabiae]